MAKKEEFPKDINEFTKLFSIHEIPYPTQEEIDNRYISTGSIKLDKMLNGGLRRGTMSEWYGPNGSGKSTFALATAAQVLYAGGSVLWLDQEHALDLPASGDALHHGAGNSPLDGGSEGELYSTDQTRSWLEINGVDPDNPNFKVFQPVMGEDTYHMVDVAVAGSLFDLVVIDSIAALNTRAELEGDIGDSHYGQVAKLNSAALKRIVARYGVSRNIKTHIFMINQIRDKINSRHGGTKSTGGNALSHYTHYRVKSWRSAAPEEKAGEFTQRSTVLVEKSRFGPQRATEVVISSKRGLDVEAEYVEFAQEAGIIHRAGAWYYVYAHPVDWKALKKVGQEKDESEGFIVNFQGEAAVKDWVSQNNEWKEELRPLL
jgi:recombination protein RecA